MRHISIVITISQVGNWVTKMKATWSKSHVYNIQWSRVQSSRSLQTFKLINWQSGNKCWCVKFGSRSPADWKCTIFTKKISPERKHYVKYTYSTSRSEVCTVLSFPFSLGDLGHAAQVPMKSMSCRNRNYSKLDPTGFFKNSPSIILLCSFSPRWGMDLVYRYVFSAILLSWTPRHGQKIPMFSQQKRCESEAKWCVVHQFAIIGLGNLFKMKNIVHIWKVIQ